MSSNNPLTCLNLFWSQSQIHSIRTSEIDDYINSNSLNNETKEEIVENFLQHYSTKTSIKACGTCGVKIIGNNGVTYNIENLSFLKVPSNFDERKTHYVFNGNKYFLYPSLILDDTFQACEVCNRSLIKGKIPKISLGNGIDFYQTSHLPTNLNALEKLFLSKLLLFGKILKIHERDPGSMTSLKGHIICVPNDGPLSFDLHGDSLPLHVKVVFIGPASNWKNAVERFKSAFTICPVKISNWINHFKYLGNPLFTTASNPSLSSITNLMEALIQQTTFSSEIKLENCINSTAGEERDLEYVLITKTPSSNTDEFFRAVATSLKISVKPNVSCLQNDFFNLKDILFQAFPWLFPAAQGFPDKNIITESFFKYLFNFHDNRFAHDQEFLFYIFNVLQRHQAAHAMSVKVKTDSSSVGKLGEIVKSPNFSSKLKRAIESPTGADAKNITRLLNPLIRFAGSKIPFSPLHRLTVLPKLYAYCHFFGLPSVFFTMSPSDCDSTLALRLCFPCLNNNDPNGLLFEMPILENRKLVISMNPVAAAAVFERLQQCVFKCLLGMQSCSSTRKTDEDPGNNSMCFGKPSAFFSVTECQGRGSLHMHALFWAGFSPIFLQDIATNSEILSKTWKQIEIMFKSSLNEDEHGLSSNVQGLRPSLKDCPPDLPSVHSKCVEVILVNNIHKHSSTCSKPPQGLRGCRMFYPQPISPESTCVQLTYSKERNRITNVTAIAPTPPAYNRTNINFLQCPVRLPDERILYYEMKRPSAQDQMVVSYSPICSALLGCNTAVYPISTRSQAKSSLYYIIKYMTKDATQIVNSLSCLIEAKKHVKANPSTAPNSGTSSRTTQHIFTRLLNNINAKQEISAQMAAAMVLGHKPHSYSHETWWCFVWPLLNSLEWQPIISGEEFNNLRNIETHSNKELEEPIFDHNICQSSEEYISITDVDGIPSAIPQHVHYLHRGPQLAIFSFYEYCACIDIVKEETTKKNPLQKGRLPNSTFDFLDGHPLHGKYVQRIRSKLRIPILAGRPAPAFPGIMVNTSSWIKKIELWTKYIISAFVPFHVATKKPPFQSYSALCKWLENCSVSENLIERQRYEIVCNISDGLSVSSTTKAVSTIYRSRARTRWGLNPANPHPKNQIEEDQDFDNLINLKREEILLSKQDLLLNHENKISDLISVFEKSFTSHFHPKEILQLTFDSNTAEALDQVNAIAGPLEPSSSDNTNDFHGATDDLDEGALNSDQEKIFNYVQSMIGTNSRFYILIHGGPGTGKSFLIKSLLELFSEESTIVCAPTGIAASQFKNGTTIHAAFNIPAFKSVMKNLTSIPKQKLTNLRIQYIRSKYLIIDEISMMDPTILALIDHRLREILNNNFPFGNLSVILVGDFHQLPPVGTVGFPTALLTESNVFTPTSHFEHGISLFKTFRKLDLTQQMRAPDDPVHVENIASLRSGSPITQVLLNTIKPISCDDFASDKKWYSAPIVVSTNDLRHQLNMFRLKQFAILHNLPILRWFYDLPESITESLPPESVAKIYESLKDHVFYFVPGAPCQLRSNINTSRGLANGSHGILSSVTFANVQDEKYVEASLLSASPGDFVDCPIPFAVKVKVGSVIVPLQLSNLESTKFRNISLPLRAFPLSLSYAITYHKVQGKTLDRQILALSTDEIRQIGFSEFFVGFTRVRNSNHMRTLNSGNLTFLIGKSVDPVLIQWESCYDLNGFFQTPNTLLPRRKKPKRL